MKTAPRGFSLAITGLCAGMAISWMDTRPMWDDTGLTAGALVLVSGSVSLAGVRPWLAAILVAGPLIVAQWHAMTAGLLIPAALSFAGACAGTLIRRAVARPSSP